MTEPEKCMDVSNRLDLVLKTSLKALEKDLCDRCLGRLFARSGFGLTNKDRGSSIRTMIALEFESNKDLDLGSYQIDSSGIPLHEKEPSKEKGAVEDPDLDDTWSSPITPSFQKPWTNEKHSEVSCWLCKDVFTKIDELAGIIKGSASEMEFHSFLVGCRIDPHTSEREQLLWQDCDPPSPEPLKEELNRAIGKVFSKLMPDKEFSRSDPDIAFIIDPLYRTVTMQIKPVFIFGRYRKLVRGIPQTRWPCNVCRGKGCQKCDDTGRIYQTSVEELIGEIPKKITNGEDFKLHGMGREDVDVLSLGDGRPFILEITRPVTRSIDLGGLEEMINGSTDGRVEVHSLRLSNRKEIPRIKEGTTRKRYSATISINGNLDEEILKYNISLLAQSPIKQRTPTRVSHRRADKVRTRNVYEASVDILPEGKAVVHLLTDGGLYIKELMHGDGGRTKPSLSSLLDREVTVETLNVTGVLYDDGEEDTGVESHGEKIQGNNG